MQLTLAHYYIHELSLPLLCECGLSVRQMFTTAASITLTALHRTCQRTCYSHSLKPMPTCIYARKKFALVRTTFLVKN